MNNKYCPYQTSCDQKATCEYPTYLTCSLKLLKDSGGLEKSVTGFINKANSGVEE